MYKSRSEQQAYWRHQASLKPGVCEFCQIDKGSPQWISEKEHFKVIRNIFPYSFWDRAGVSDHVMIVPKEHVTSLKELTVSAKAQYTDILSDFETDGYNVYARPPTSIIKSVPHQHTHCIKPAGGPKKLVLFLKKPYLRLVV